MISLFSLCSIYFSHEKTSTDGGDGEDRRTDPDSIHPSQEPTLLITGVCIPLTDLQCPCILFNLKSQFGVSHVSPQ